MRCRNCNYELWNIRTRQCPECAAAFKPGDFEFVPNSVKFCCPHCGTAYYGTDARGHLTPSIFDCVGCSKRIHMDEMVLAPAEGFSESQTRTERMPWMERETRGVLPAWFATIKWAMVQPNRLIKAIPEDASVFGAMLYAIITVMVFLSFGWFLPTALMVLIYGTAGGGLPMGFAQNSLVVMIVYAAVTVVFVLLWPFITHLLLMMTGKLERGVSRTWQAICYSAGAAAPASIPVCGHIFGLIWWVISATNMVKEAHRIHGGRAAFATIVWPILFVIGSCVVSWMMMIMLPMMLMGGMMGGGGPFGGATTPANQPVWMMSSALNQYGWQNRNQGPEHVIELMIGGNYFWAVGGGGNPFCYTSTKTTAQDIPVGTGTLQSFQQLPRSQQFGVVQQMINAQPANIVAHRFGDYVFTYHGSTLNGSDRNLWVVVMLADPAVNGPPAPSDPVIIGMEDSMTVTQITYSQLPAELLKQNVHRAALNLPPLPDPATVLHGQPAVAPPVVGAGGASSSGSGGG